MRVLSLFLLVFFISCSDESDNGFGNNSGNNLGFGEFTVKIDGTNWNASKGIVFANITAVDTISSLLITAAKSLSSSDAEAMAILISSAGNINNLEDTFQLNSISGSALAFSRDIGETSISYISMSGQVNISKVTATNVIGTFNAFCVNEADENDTITMTDGAFNATIGN